ncbi:MAG TPA: fibronectin type III domain-containing protein, partial [Flavisolibacter sp.]|nr:fibronectin type III domain-containing protein [Flavisolibacter sp.]
SGLSASKKYNLAYLSSLNRPGSFITNYTVNGQTIGLEAGSNTSKLAKFNGLVANASGQIEISVTKATNSAYAILNALVIQAYDPGTLLTPSNLTALGTGRSQITLNWVDNSEETSFEIWRSTSSNGTYSLAGTVGANVTTYTDNGLSENTTYYYKVRAVTSSINSSFSNIASGKTFAYMVQVNFNFDNPAAAPWNNTNSLPEQFAVYPNLMNDLGNPSGIDMNIVSDFSGVNPDGMITGNNSGVVPDNVMRSSWYNGPGVTSVLRIDGLSQVNEYNFVFFNSRNGGGDRTTIYTIGNQSVSLNASYNVNNTVQINHVKPDENGSVFISISLGSTATFAYINGMIIQGYSSDSTAVVQNLNTIVKDGNKATSPLAIARMERNADSLATESTVTAYPNPFRNGVTLRVEVPVNIPVLTVKVTDMSGRVVRLQQFKDLPKGIWQQNIDLNKNELGAG